MKSCPIRLNNRRTISDTGARFEFVPDLSGHPAATLTPEQLRAARQLLGWSRSVVAGRVGVSHSSVVVFETGARAPRVLDLAALRAILEAAGVVFEGNGANAAETR